MEANMFKNISCTAVYPFESEFGTIRNRRDHEALIELRQYERVLEVLVAAPGTRYAAQMTGCLIR